MILFAHPTGNANARNAALGFAEAGLLAELHTAIAAAPGNVFDRLSRWPGMSEIARRRVDDRLGPYLRLSPMRELARLAATRLGARSLTRHETGALCIDRVYRDLDQRVARRLRELQRAGRPPAAVYAYEDGALDTFRTARDLGIRCLYDLPIGYWREARRIQQEEGERRPAWRDTMPALIDSEDKLARKDAEIAAADVVYVASQYTASTLRHSPAVPRAVHVIPYGCPPVQKNPGNERPSGEPLRVLFVGSLSQRKGLADLLDAVDSVAGAVTLTLIGRPVGSCPARDAALEKHRWIESLPHEAVLKEMSQHDVLVFPSLFEGFGLVVTEALSQGLPVITTTHTCGPDVLDDGVDGFLVPVCSPESIASKLDFLAADRDRLAEMKIAARQKAAARTWQGYRTALATQSAADLKPEEEPV